MIDRLVLAHHAILLAEGWKRALIATAAGAVAALALPPFGLFPVFALSFPVAIWLIDGTTADPARIPLRSFLAAAKDGWWFGYGYFLCGLWWIGAAFLVESDEFLWLMPFGVLGLPAGLAVFHALGFALARLFWSTGTSRIFAFAFGMGALEMARQFVFTGFPWNLFGHGFGASLIMGQFASLVGADGLTILALVIFSTPALLVSTASVSAKRVIRLAVGALALIAIFGTLRLMTSGGISNAPSGDSVAGVRLRLVQPNTAQRDAIAERDQSVVLARLFALSDRATGPNAMGIGDATHVFWPEAPFPSILTRDQKAMAEIARLLPAKTTLLTGAIRMEDGPPRRFYNSLEVFGARANILATYNKNHLVPFGEYLPFDRLLSAIGLRRFVQAPGNFTEGKGRKLLDVPGLPPVLALICYEAIFPHEINAANPRPGVIVNITNDAWFGQTIGPRQHFAQARLRAIEFGLPVIRTASTGISAVIDPYGRNVASLGSGIEGVIDAGLPKAITPTIYTEHGFVIVLALLFTVLIGSFASKRARTVRRSQN